MTDPTPLGTGPGDPTDPAEGLDPRVEAAVKVIGPTLHGWHDGFAEGECPECQEVTRDALAAADARRLGRDSAEAWLSKRDLARTLGFSARWVDRRVSEGMPCERFGARLRFQRGPCEAWLRDRQGAP